MSSPPQQKTQNQMRSSPDKELQWSQRDSVPPQANVYPNDDNPDGWNQDTKDLKKYPSGVYRREDSPPPNRSNNPEQWPPDALNESPGYNVRNESRTEKESFQRSLPKPTTKKSKTNTDCERAPSLSKVIDQHYAQTRTADKHPASQTRMVSKERSKPLLTGNSETEPQMVCVPIDQVKFATNTKFDQQRRASIVAEKQYQEIRTTDRPVYTEKRFEESQYTGNKYAEPPTFFEQRPVDRSQLCETRVSTRPQFQSGLSDNSQYLSRQAEPSYYSGPDAANTSMAARGLSNTRLFNSNLSNTKISNDYGKGNYFNTMPSQDNPNVHYRYNHANSMGATGKMNSSTNENQEANRRLKMVNFSLNAAKAQDKFFNIVCKFFSYFFPMLTVLTTGLLALLIILFIIELLMELFSTKCLFWRPGCRL